VVDLVRVRERIYPVGRLDYQTEGLILLTNDGEFARTVASAGEGIPKVYHVKVQGTPDERAVERLRRGLRLPDGNRLARSRVRLLRPGNNPWYEVVLTQGKNLQVRRMFEAVGHSVLKLRRVAIAFLSDAGLPVGASRALGPREVARLLALGAR
jgi:23S rRNA pseudouridine2605 synthase